MGWEFIQISRHHYKSDDNWGDLHIKTPEGQWEFLCHTYELPWRPDKLGKSSNNISRVKIGSYECFVRNDGHRGWRLELLGTSHRSNIQIHRAHTSMYIEGCILPIHFTPAMFNAEIITKGNPAVEAESVKLMKRIEVRHKQLAAKHKGNPTVLFCAVAKPQTWLSEQDGYLFYR